MELIRTDKNGTKYYADYTCPRCGGHGGSDAWKYTGWTCYKCGGTGKLQNPRIIKEYTPEYAAKLAEKRAEKARRAEENRRAHSGKYNEEFLKRNEFDETGITYCAVGNTYEIKDELKAAGFKFNNFLGWHKAEYDGNFRVTPIAIEDCGEMNDFGEYVGFNYGVVDMLKEINENVTRKTSPSEYQGEVGQKITFNVADYKALYNKSGPTNWISGATVYKIVDEDGNIYIWATNKLFHEHYWNNNNEEVDAVAKTITATVKDHKEYKGERQTVITRGKIEYETTVKEVAHKAYNSEAEEAFELLYDLEEDI